MEERDYFLDTIKASNVQLKKISNEIAGILVDSNSSTKKQVEASESFKSKSEFWIL